MVECPTRTPCGTIPISSSLEEVDSDSSPPTFSEKFLLSGSAARRFAQRRVVFSIERTDNLTILEKKILFTVDIFIFHSGGLEDHLPSPNPKLSGNPLSIPRLQRISPTGHNIAITLQ